jgi:hypothetical protein
MAFALGMNWWILEIPDGVDDIGIRVFTGDGIEFRPMNTRLFGSGPVKAILWLNGDTMCFAVTKGKQRSSIRFPNPFMQGTHALGGSEVNGEVIGLGQVVMATTSRSSLLLNELHPGDIGIAVDRKRKPPTPRQQADGESGETE